MKRLASLILAATLGCADSGLRPTPESGDLYASFVARNGAVRLLSLRRILDSIPTIPAAGGDRAAVLGLDGLSIEARVALEKEVARIWDLVVPDSSAIRLVVRFYVIDGASYSAFAGSILPSRTDGRTCLSVVPVSRHWNVALEPTISPTWLADIIAGCAFVGRFGPPGPAMERWLLETEAAGVSVLDWRTRPGSTRPIWFNRGLEFLGAANRITGRASSGSWTTMWAALDRVSVQTAPYRYSLPGVGCIAGRRSNCGSLLEAPARDWPGRVALAGVAPRTMDGPFARSPVRTGVWISELIRARGEAKFVAFWTAGGTLKEAYRAAYAEDLEADVADFVQVEWQGRMEQPPVRLGVDIDRGSVVAFSLWFLGLFSLAAMTGRRQSISL